VSNLGSLFEFSEPENSQKWVAKPGRQTAFPLSIRNETGEGHDVAVCVEEPANWAWALPQRISLDPGDLTTVSIVFSPSRETTVAAGEHRAAIRLRDLEGVIFAECTRMFEVEERQELAMTVALRGPLMSFGLAEGFVLHCTLANRGNVDVSVTPTGDAHPSLTFSKRTVQVPFQGEVSFDIEVRWNATQRANHPETVTLRAPYRDGEASATIEWRYIAEALEPFMPIYSTAEAEDELLSLSWMQQPEPHSLRQRDPGFVEFKDLAPGSFVSGEQLAPTKGGNSPDAGAAATSNGHAQEALVAHTPAGKDKASENLLERPPPFRFLSKGEVQYTYGRRLNPWWPLVQKSAGRWRVKPLPLLMLVIAFEGMVIGVQQSQHDAFQAAAGGKILPITRALRIVPDTAAAIVGFGKHAILVTWQGAHRLRPEKKTHAVALATALPARATVPPPAKRRPSKAKSHSPPAKAHRTSTTSLATTLRAPAQTSASGAAVKPSISSLTARYVAPNTIVVGFAGHGLTNLQLTVADGATILYNKPQLANKTIRIHVPHRWQHPLQVSLVGSAPHGVVMQRRAWVWKPGHK